MILLTAYHEISNKKYMLTSLWPHHPEHTLFHFILEAKQLWAQLILDGRLLENTESRCCRLLEKGHEDDGLEYLLYEDKWREL